MAGFELKTAWLVIFFMSKQAFVGKQALAQNQSSGTGF